MGPEVSESFLADRKPWEQVKGVQTLNMAMWENRAEMKESSECPE